MGKLAPFMSTLCGDASFPAPRCLFLQRILSRPSVDLVDTRLEIAFCSPTHSNRDLSQRHIKIEMNDMMKRGPRLPLLDCLLLCPGTQTSRQGISEGLCGIIMQYLRRRTWNFPARSLALRDLPVAYFPSESFFYMRRTFMDIMERARATHEGNFRS